MIKYLKVYFISAIGSVMCLMFPWILAYLGIISNFDVLEKYSFISAAIALVASYFYVLQYISKIKPRFIILILNPATGYAIFLIWFMIAFSSTPWNGFDKLMP